MLLFIMSLLMSHLYVAETLLNKIEIKKIPQYYLGSIVPDATEIPERNTHLNNKIEKMNTEYYINKWKSNVIDYFIKYRTKNNYDFLIGYCIHILTDIYFYKNVIEPFIQYYKNNHIENFSNILANEFAQIDYEIYFKYNYKEKIFPIINNSIRFNFNKNVLRKEMNELIDCMLNKRYNSVFNKTIYSNKYITYDKIMENNDNTIIFIEEEINRIICESKTST